MKRHAQEQTYRTYVLDTKTGDLYVDDPVVVVAIKCSMIALGGALLSTVFQICSAMVRLGMDTAIIGAFILKECGDHFIKRDYGMSFTVLREKVSLLFCPVVSHHLWKIVSSPFYGLGVELAALYGIFRPYEGRSWVAFIERQWQDNVSYKNSCCLIDSHEDDPQLFCSTLKDNLHRTETFYLAMCFQQRGNIHNKAKFTEHFRRPVQYFPN